MRLPYRTRYHREWDRQVRAITGGLTIFRPVIGQWINPADGQLFKERMIPVRVMCDQSTALEVAKRVQKHYNQIAVMIYRVSDLAMIIK